MMQATEKRSNMIDDAIALLCGHINPIAAEVVAWAQASGRVIAENIILDRSSPPCDVSAMDGYAIRMADLTLRTLPVSQEIAAGVRARPHQEAAASRIFTGAMIPAGADAVIPREQVTEHADHIELPANLVIQTGQHIRAQGENAAAGHTLAESGQVITAPLLAAATSCGKALLNVHRRVRLGVIVTGNEMCPLDQPPQPWQLRDGNGPALMGLLSQLPWLQVNPIMYAQDEMQDLTRVLANTLDNCDALILTGGVSAGDYDLVPAALKNAGASIYFHKLPIKPGRPVLGAISAKGQPILALPGNPVATLVTARRIALPALQTRAGITRAKPSEWMEVADTITPLGKLTWLALVKMTDAGKARIVAGRGSGDWVSAADSDGFIEIPPERQENGKYRFFQWSL